MASLEIRHLTKEFGDGGDRIVAVDDLNISVADGQFLVLVGPSGCGKSTTLRCVAGLEDATEGEILFGGEDVANRRPQDRDVAMVFQNYALYPHMSARRNMSFGLEQASSLSSEEIHQRVDSAAEMMGIDDLLEKRPGELSGGQQQRVALGRAIVREPEIFLMDEPLSNLDAKLRTKMRTELQELHDTLGITTVYVTHDQEEAMTMADQIAVLDGGELQQLGTPLECYHEPANRFVAGFIGSPSMNFFDGRIENGTFVHDGFEYHFPPTIRDELTVGSDTATLGIRPEDVEIADGPTENSIAVTANVIEPMGDLNHVYVDIGDVNCTVTLPGDTQIYDEDEFHIVFPPDRIHLFDGETGEAIKNRDLETDSTTVIGKAD
jgi:multiple sugar transport system ATP-binding protein